MEFQVKPDACIGILRPRHPDAPRPSHDRVILSIRVEDIEAAHWELKARFPGLPAAKKHPWGPRAFELRDPEGWRIEFWSYEE